MEGRSLLVSDVDNTLLGDDAATRRFATWITENRDRVLLAYNSGRFVDSVWQSVEQTDLPVPDAIIGGVGTQIVFPPSQAILDDWPPNQDGWDASVIRTSLAEQRELELQPEVFQSTHKASYFGYDLPESFLTHVEEQLTSRGLHAKVIYSSNRDLDVLPAGTGKGLAARRLAEHFCVRTEDVIVCGDSGNDLAMFQHGFRGVVVANAHDELKALSQTNIYHAKASFAAGVLEGVCHWLS